MANIKKRRNGVYEYRRVVPIRLRGHLPPVPGFADKTTRTEFTRSLETPVVREANKRAATIDALIDRAFVEAEQRLTSGEMPSAKPNGVSTKQQQTAYGVLDPDTAFAAFDAWLVSKQRIARLEAFQIGQAIDLGPLAAARSERNYRIQQPNPWRHVPEFDPTLLKALASQGIRISPDHPALANLRPAFAAAWRNLIAAENRFRAGQWDDEPEPAGGVRSPPAPAFGRTLEQCCANYYADRGDRADVRLYVRYLIDVVSPNRPISTISIDDIRVYRDLLRRKPAHLKASQQAMSLQELAAAGDVLPPIST